VNEDNVAEVAFRTGGDGVKLDHAVREFVNKSSPKWNPASMMSFSGSLTRNRQFNAALSGNTLIMMEGVQQRLCNED
jgi:hypothetical protein